MPLPGLLRPSFVSQPRAWLGPPGAGPEFGEITPPRKAHSASLRSEEGGCTEGRAGSGESGRGWGAVLTAGEGAGLRGQILGRPPGSRRPAPGATDSPFRPLCSAPSPAPFALAQLSHGSSSPSPARLPAATVAGLLAPTPASAHRPLPSGAAAPGEKGGPEGSATRETNVLGASPASFPRVRRARLAPRPLSHTSSPPAWVLIPRPGAPGSGPPAPPPSGSERPPDSPRCPASVPAVLAREAPEPSPKLAAKLAPPARRPPLTGGKGRCARAQSPRRPPPARYESRRLGSARGALCPSLAGAWAGAPAGPEPVARPAGLGPGPPPRPAPRAPPVARSAPGSVPGWAARRASGSRGSPAGCVGALAAAAATRAGPPHRGPPPPPRPGRPTPPACPFSPCPQTLRPRRKQATRSPGFEPQAQWVCDLGLVNFEDSPLVCKVRPAAWGAGKKMMNTLGTPGCYFSKTYLAGKQQGGEALGMRERGTPASPRGHRDAWGKRRPAPWLPLFVLHLVMLETTRDGDPTGGRAERTGWGHSVLAGRAEGRPAAPAGPSWEDWWARSGAAKTTPRPPPPPGAGSWLCSATWRPEGSCGPKVTLGLERSRAHEPVTLGGRCFISSIFLTWGPSTVQQERDRRDGGQPVPASIPN